MQKGRLLSPNNNSLFSKFRVLSTVPCHHSIYGSPEENRQSEVIFIDWSFSGNLKEHHSFDEKKNGWQIDQCTKSYK